MSNPTSLFQQLRKTKQKAMRYSFHQDNYRFYSHSRIIPTGIQVKCTPALGTLSGPLQQKWNQLLYGPQVLSHPPEVNQVELSQDLTQYYRRIRLREVFLDEPASEPEPFRKKSSWVPPKNRVPAMETYVQVVSSQVNNSANSPHRTHDNLPREERQALKSLRTRTDIIIKPADKGSAVVVMDRQKYIDETMKHLNNRTNYALVDSDPTDSFSQQIQTTLDDMHARDELTDKAHAFLSPTDSKAARFDLLPKIHKPGNPGRPIVSGNGSPTENISLYVDHFIKPLVSQTPSYIHDTPDFLRKLEAIKDQIPSTAIIDTCACVIPVY
ncbi:uncharacterized protein [Amphiura filiformis]|uniref:uncharacterized protein n=1 Tax=Amphiura filiformis TaxID=82378 RepID=UPI003B22538E